MTRRTVAFDLFHTLVDPEPLRPTGFDRVGAVAAACRLDRHALAEFWAATYVERETTTIDLDASAAQPEPVGQSSSAGGRNAAVISPTTSASTISRATLIAFTIARSLDEPCEMMHTPSTPSSIAPP